MTPLRPLNIEIMSLNRYRNQIDDLIKGRSKLPFMLNGSEDHAAIIVERMFANAINDMCILTHRLDPAIYADEDVLVQAESFATNPESNTRILVENISDESLAIHDMNKLANALPNIAIRRLKPEISEKLKFNFSVMDSRIYRFESDKHKVNATVRRDDKEFARDAAEYFDALWQASA